MAYRFSSPAPAPTITAAALQAMSPNIYYWIDKLGNLLSSGQATIAANTAIVNPQDQAIYDLSTHQAVELILSHGALTSAVGGTIAVAEIQPDFPAIPIAFSAPLVIGATTQNQALAATAESLRLSVVAPYTGPRLIKVAIAILFTTVPTAGTGIKLELWGHIDGILHMRG